MDSDHQLGNFLRIAQERASLKRDRLIARQQFTHGQTHIGRLQGIAHIGDGDTGALHTHRVQLNQYRTSRTTDSRHASGAGYAFQIIFYTVRDTLQIIGASVRIFTVQGQTQDRHILNPLRLHQGRQHTCIFG